VPCTTSAPAGSGPLSNSTARPIPTGLLESELFGHEKGALHRRHRPKDRPLRAGPPGGPCSSTRSATSHRELQPKLLRALQEQDFERLGGTRTVRVDVRLVAATNHDLAQMVGDGRFRNDLYLPPERVPGRAPALARPPG